MAQEPTAIRQVAARRDPDAPARPRPGPAGGNLDRAAVLVPCYNEAPTIASVVAGFGASCPRARIYVYDNNSTDRTVEIAREAGAEVRAEHRQGKGHVVRRMFTDIDADCYILVDGDDTYDPRVAQRLVELVVDQHYDFVNVARVSTSAEAYRTGHRLGNRVLNRLVRTFFGRESRDMLSGYKALSRRFVKSFPAMSRGFEIETELMVHALEMRVPMLEISAPYRERPAGSSSKLHTIRDGLRIMFLISRLVKNERPLQFFAGIGIFVILAAVLLGIPILTTFIATGLVPRLPTAVLCMGLVVLGWLSIFAGLILDVVTKARQELKRLFYLSIPPAGSR